MLKCWHFNIYEQDKFRAQFVEHEKSFRTLWPVSKTCHNSGLHEMDLRNRIPFLLNANALRVNGHFEWKNIGLYTTLVAPYTTTSIFMKRCTLLLCSIDVV